MFRTCEPKGSNVTFRLDDDHEAFCYLKYSLEPRYSVVSEPSADYFAEWQFHYKVLQGANLIAEFQGDFRSLQTGQLCHQVNQIVDRLNANSDDNRQPKSESRD